MLSFVEVLKIIPEHSDLFLLVSNDYLDKGQAITFGDVTQVVKILRDCEVEATVSFPTGFDDSLQIVMNGSKLKRQADGYITASDELMALEEICNLYNVSAYTDMTVVYELGPDLVVIDEWMPKGNDIVCTK